MRKPTRKPHRFISEYIKDHNGAQAYIRAGYSPRGARQNAHRLLTKDYIQEAIAAKEAEIRAENQDQAIDVRARLAQDIVDGDFNASNRLRAYELYAKLTGQLVDRAEVKQVTTNVTLSQRELDELRAASAIMHSRRHGVVIDALPGATTIECHDAKACFSDDQAAPRKRGVGRAERRGTHREV